MPEYDFLHPLNDLFPSGEVCQDWPSAMHDHMSTPLNISAHCYAKSAVQAFWLMLTKRPAASEITVNVFSSLSSISGMPMNEHCCMCCEEATNGFLGFRWSVELISDLCNPFFLSSKPCLWAAYQFMFYDAVEYLKEVGSPRVLSQMERLCKSMCMHEPVCAHMCVSPRIWTYSASHNFFRLRSHWHK